MKTCDVFVKSMFLIILPSTGQPVNAQGDWETLLPLGDPNGILLDIQETSMGYTCLYGSSAENVHQTQLIPISSEGEPLSYSVLADGVNNSFGATSILMGNDSSLHVVTGSYKDDVPQSHGTVHFKCTLEGDMISSTPTSHFSGYTPLFTTIGSWISDSTFVIPISARVGPGPGFGMLNRVAVATYHENGSLLNDTLYNFPGDAVFRYPYHAVDPGDGNILISMHGGWEFFDGMGMTHFVEFDQDLNHVGGFATPTVNGNSVFEPDSILREGLFITLLSDGSFLTSGRYQTPSNGTRSAILRYDEDGGTIANYLPQSGYMNDYPAYYQSHDFSVDNRVVFAYVEHYDPFPFGTGTPEHPSNIHIVKLDTLLTPQCDLVINGFDDNFYYMLHRIKWTSDGGVILIGSRRDLNTTEPPVPWVRKIAPNDCLTGIHETQPGEQEVTVFPNPGTNGFTLQIQGPVVQAGKVQLHDMQGRLVRSVPLRSSQAYMPAEDLAPGLYLYRVIDSMGRPITDGKWVRE